MEKNETIFFAVMIIVYIICAFALNMPQVMNILFGITLLAILLIMALVKYQQKFENEKISKLAKITAIILFVAALIISSYEIWFKKTLFINSAFIYPIFIAALICMWFFKKNSNE